MNPTTPIREHKSVQISEYGLLLKKVVPGSFPHEPKHYLHRDDYYAFGLIESGSCEINIDFKPCRFGAGETLFIRPGQVHSYVDQTDLSAYILLADSGFVSESAQYTFDRCALKRQSARTDERKINELRTLFDLLLHRIGNAADDSAKEIIRTLTAAAIGIIAESVEEAAGILDTGSRRQTEIALAFSRLLRNDLCHSRQPSYYASRLNLSTGYLNETIKSVTGLNVRQYIQNEVLLRAKRLLVHTDKQVREIGFELGFDDHSYFTRLFTRVVGATPMQFRQRNRE